jgi:cytochrome c oxidase assembly factor CtaG
MACCGLVVYLLVRLVGMSRGSATVPTGLTRVKFVGSGDRGAQRAALPWLLAGTVVELALAVGLAALVLHLIGSGQHRMVMAQVGAHRGVGVALGVTGLLVGYLSGIAGATGRLPVGPLLAWIGGLACAGVALVGPVAAAVGESHLAYMVQLELLMVVAPVLLVVGVRDLRRGHDRPRGLMLAAPLVWAGVLVAWHLPGLHESVGTEPVRLASFVAGGLVLWWCVLDRHVPAGDIAVDDRRARGRVLLVALEASALVGLTLLVAPAPLYADMAMGWAGLSPMADQRAAGALMMVVEIIVAAIWVLRGAARRTRGVDLFGVGIVRGSAA